MYPSIKQDKGYWKESWVKGNKNEISTLPISNDRIYSFFLSSIIIICNIDKQEKIVFYSLTSKYPDSVPTSIRFCSTFHIFIFIVSFRLVCFFIFIFVFILQSHII